MPISAYHLLNSHDSTKIRVVRGVREISICFVYAGFEIDGTFYQYEFQQHRIHQLHRTDTMNGCR